MKNLILTSFIVVVIFVGCKTFFVEEKSGCPTPPDTFEESDIFGTWVAGFQSIGYTDTIIIREDGYYKQSIWIAQPYYEFESDWLSWWLEYKDGVYYLHLEEMKMCVYWLGMDCESNEGGDQVWHGEDHWLAFCRGDEWVNTPGEGVLILLGTKEEFVQPPRGFELVSLGKSTIGVTVYKLQEP